MGEARILQDHSFLKEYICKMDCLFLPAEIMSGFGAIFYWQMQIWFLWLDVCEGMGNTRMYRIRKKQKNL